MLADRKTLARAKALRRPLTNAERILWSRLKGRQLHGWLFRVQHPVGPYIADFACVRRRLVVEVDGATHSTLAERQHDERRARYLNSRGWMVLRFWNDEIYRDLDAVLRSLSDILPPPSR